MHFLSPSPTSNSPLSFSFSVSSPSVSSIPQDSRLSSLQNAPIQPAPSHSQHPMQTRSKSGIFKPKIFSAALHQEPTCVPLALAHLEWKKAMQDEFSALLRNHTRELVSLTAASHIIQTKWVFRTKLKADGSLDKYKAQLVAKGFQQNACIDILETFSPVIKPSTIRIIFTLAISKGWDIQQIDVNNAFLNGDLHEDVFMTQPEGFEDPIKPNHVCKLCKALYGLKQAPRAWFEKLKSALLSWGFKKSVSDTSLFFTHKNGHAVWLGWFFFPSCGGKPKAQFLRPLKP